MFRLLRSLCTGLGFLVLLLGAVFIFRNEISQKIITWTTHQLTSFPLSISKCQIPKQLPLNIKCQNVLLKNPIDFPHPQAALISQMTIQWSEKPWNQSKIQIESVSLTIEELILVKTANAGNNLNRWIEHSRHASSLFDSVQIQRFNLSLTQVLYYDYTATRTPLPITYSFQAAPLSLEQPISPRQIPTLILDYVNQHLKLPLDKTSFL